MEEGRPGLGLGTTVGVAGENLAKEKVLETLLLLLLEPQGMILEILSRNRFPIFFLFLFFWLCLFVFESVKT